MLDIGGYGRDNDAALFTQSAIEKGIQSGELNIPGEKLLNNNILLPHVFIGDGIFPLKTWLIKPFPGKRLSQENRIYNYRLSRARRTIENTFGIYAAKWIIFRRPIHAHPETVERITKATVCLHNYLRFVNICINFYT